MADHVHHAADGGGYGHLFEVFTPRRQCMNFEPDVVWTHFAADLLIALAYFSIPFALVYFVRRRRDLAFNWMFLLFALFIVLCGTTHIFSVVALWMPVYRLDGYVKLATALASVGTAVLLWRLMPRALAIPSAEALRETNQRLADEVAERKRAEADLARLNADLEGRVRARTTELLATNAMLGTERERFRTTLASIGDAVIATDEGGRITFLNPVAERLTGWAAGQCQGQPLAVVFRIVNEITREPVESPVEKVLREGTVVGLANHTVLLAKNGAEHPIDDSGAPIRAADGSISGVVLVFRDVTERRQAEEALQESEEKFRLLADTIPQLAWMARPDGHIYWYNRQWYEYTGTTPDVVEGWGWQSVPDPAVLPDVLERWKGSIESGEPFDMVFPLRGADGRFRPFLTRVNPLKDESGRVTLWFGTNTDISEQKAAEEALQEADRRKDEFLATLAHELRNPLAPVRTGLQILKLSGPGGEDAPKAREMMERQLGHMVRLIDDLLDVSRISRGLVELRKERLDVRRVFEAAVEASRSLIDAHRHELMVRIPDEPIVLDADPTRMAQVVANLLNNSAKYTPDGGRIELTAERDGPRVVIRVTDTGVGLPRDMLPKVFDLFTRVGRTRDRTDGGLGIGLSLVKKLVELHGGTITAESAGPGAGSTFTASLPLAAGAEPAGSAEGTGSETRPSGDGRRVLIVDDNKDGAESMAMMLQLTGHLTRTAHSGEEALEAAREFRPEVVFCDIGMPGMNGYEVARRLRADASLARTVLVALTGWGSEGDKRQSREAGFHFHLTKPVEADQVGAILAKTGGAAK